jgi:hypothetical protein
MKELSIKVNGEDVRLTDFPREIITNLILAILKSLKDVDEDVKSVVIELKAK